MRHSWFLLIALLFSIRDSAQVRTPREYEEELHRSYQKLLRFKFGNSLDSSEKENVSFRRKLQFYTSICSARMNYPFRTLIKDGIKIVNSGDGMFRIYSWDTFGGGTEYIFENVLQYKVGSKVYSTFVHDTDAGPKQRYVYFYSDIFILKENARTYYLAIQNGIFSTKDISEGIIAFAIEKGKLTDSTGIFKTDEGLTNEMNFDYDFFKVVKGNDRPVKLISYNPESKTISTPEIDEDGKPTGKYDLYQFTGKYFERVTSVIPR